MTRIFMMTEQQHAQIVAAYTEDWGDIEQAVAMLKAMQPVSPVGWWDTIDGGDFTYSIGEMCGGDTDGLKPLYTPEQSK